MSFAQAQAAAGEAPLYAPSGVSVFAFAVVIYVLLVIILRAGILGPTY
ncbi:MAG: hypothetical protein KM296_04440 [Brockia lithotrophica]|nr:hypothetical protein [Brockia lithotrophica]MBT9252928.1 hypothetical protein [Brockia lithotrophica]